MRYILGGGTGALPNTGFPDVDVEIDDTGRLVGVTPSTPAILTSDLVRHRLLGLLPGDHHDETCTVAELADSLRRSHRGMVVEERALQSILVNDLDGPVIVDGVISWPDEE